MKTKVLFVDDDNNILQGYRRSLRSEYEVNTALGAEAGIELIRSQERPYSIIVSDMRMPGIDGIEFLSQVMKLSPRSIRIMLSGDADQQAVVDSVNEGQVYRFINKPCEQEELKQILSIATRQYQLEISEHELLTRTLTGSMHVLTDILSMLNPKAFGSASMVRQLTMKVSNKLKVKNSWECEIAGMLALLGTISVPEEVMDKVEKKTDLTSNEKKIFEAHPDVGATLVGNIPRLDNVADYIRYQNKTYDGKGYPKDSVKGEDIPIGGRILKVVHDFQELVDSGRSQQKAFQEIQANEIDYDMHVVAALEEIIEIPAGYINRDVSVKGLTVGCILDQDVLTTDGTLLLQKGQEINESMRMRLIFHSQTAGIQEPISIIEIPNAG